MPSFDVGPPSAECIARQPPALPITVVIFLIRVIFPSDCLLLTGRWKSSRHAASLFHFPGASVGRGDRMSWWLHLQPLEAKTNSPHSAPPAATTPCFSPVHPVPNVISYPPAALHMPPCCVSSPRVDTILPPTCCVPIQNTRYPRQTVLVKSGNTGRKDLLNRAVTPASGSQHGECCVMPHGSPSPHVLREC